MQKFSSEYKGKQLIKLNQCLDEIWSMITSKPYSGIERDRFYFTIFTKLTFTLEGISILLYNLDRKPHYQVVMALSLRTCMLDIVGLYYVMDVHEIESLANERVTEIMADHIKFAKYDLTGTEMEELKKEFPQYFAVDGSPRKIKTLKTDDMIEAIRNYPFLKEETVPLRKIYRIFSKYEHNGAFTYNLLMNPYTEIGMRNMKNIIYDAVEACSVACKYISSHWIENDDAMVLNLDLAIKDWFEH